MKRVDKLESSIGEIVKQYGDEAELFSPAVYEKVFYYVILFCVCNEGRESPKAETKR